MNAAKILLRARERDFHVKLETTRGYSILGVVEKVGLRSTEIRTSADEIVVVQHQEIKAVILNEEDVERWLSEKP